MNNFNLLVSTSRFNEVNAKAELWFLLLICGDKYPIIASVEFSGLITAFTRLDAKDVIFKIKEILVKDPNFFQYILKIIPIDYVCETNVGTIKELVQKNHEAYINHDESFKILLKRRKNEKIDRYIFIESIAKLVDKKVDLTNPDKLIWIEVLGNRCGISFLKSDQIISLNSKTLKN
ncbi:MAG: THUMP domain-containing protein [Candidatus Thorarchaeota archaeon]